MRKVLTLIIMMQVTAGCTGLKEIITNEQDESETDMKQVLIPTCTEFWRDTCILCSVLTGIPPFARIREASHRFRQDVLRILSASRHFRRIGRQILYCTGWQDESC